MDLPKWLFQPREKGPLDYIPETGPPSIEEWRNEKCMTMRGRIYLVLYDLCSDDIDPNYVLNKVIDAMKAENLLTDEAIERLKEVIK